MYLIRTIEEKERQTEMLNIGRPPFLFISSFRNVIRSPRIPMECAISICFSNVESMFWKYNENSNSVKKIDVIDI